MRILQTCELIIRRIREFVGSHTICGFASYSMLNINEIKLSSLIQISNEPYVVIKADHHKVARGGAVLKNKAEKFNYRQCNRKNLAGQ